MKNVDVEKEVSVGQYHKALNEISELQKQIEIYQLKSPLVGVRWYGQGAIRIGLSNPVAGNSSVVLEGYGDSAVIDYASWRSRIRSIEAARDGVLVRDDSVIEEKGFNGVIGEKDIKKNPNAFTDEEIEKLLKNNIDKLKKVVDGFTHHFPGHHFLKVAENIGFNDRSVLAVIEKKYEYLEAVYRWDLLHIRDLNEAMERRKLDPSVSREAMVEKLVRLELNIDE